MGKYYYNLYLGTYEESERLIFESDKKLTEKQFYGKLKKAALEALKSKEEDIGYNLNWFDLFNAISEELYNKQGLYTIKINKGISLFGWNGFTHGLTSNKPEFKLWKSESNNYDKDLMKTLKPIVLPLMRKNDKKTEKKSDVVA